MSTTPPSPSGTDTTPQVSVTGEPGTTLELFTTADCTGPVADSDTVPGGGQIDFATTVPADQTTTFSARQTDAAGNVSDCSDPLAYTHDSADPAPPTLTSTVPSTPGNDSTPNVRGTAESGSIVTLYKQAACAGPIAGSGPAASFADPGLTSTAVLSGQTTTFSATATDAVGNVSACSTANVTYFFDDDAPTAPTITGTDPPSPSNVGAPLVEGTAEPNADIEVFVGTTCTGTPAATTTADGSGDWSVATPVTANASNSLRARQTDAAGNVSGCSGTFTYVEDSVAPDAPSITSTLPASPSQEDQPTVTAEGTPGLPVRVYATACSGHAARQRHGGRRRRCRDRAHEPAQRGDEQPARRHRGRRGQPLLVLGRLPVRPRHHGARGAGAVGDRAQLAVDGQHARDPRHRRRRRHHDRRAPRERELRRVAVATGTPAQLASAGGLAPPAQLNGTTVSYSATATDQAGNVSVCSNALSYTEQRATTAVAEVEPNQNDVEANAQGITFSEDHLVSARSRATRTCSSTAPRWRSSSASSCSRAAPSSAPPTT